MHSVSITKFTVQCVSDLSRTNGQPALAWLDWTGTMYLSALLASMGNRCIINNIHVAGEELNGRMGTSILHSLLYIRHGFLFLSDTKPSNGIQKGTERERKEEERLDWTAIACTPSTPFLLLLPLLPLLPLLHVWPLLCHVTFSYLDPLLSPCLASTVRMLFLSSPLLSSGD